MRNGVVCVAIGAAAVGFALSASVALAQAPPGVRSARDIPAQERAASRRPPVRIDVYRNRRPMVRACAPVFEERWIPQWGGRVLYAGQSCRWVPAGS